MLLRITAKDNMTSIALLASDTNHGIDGVVHFYELYALKLFLHFLGDISMVECTHSNVR